MPHESPSVILRGHLVIDQFVEELAAIDQRQAHRQRRRAAKVPQVQGNGPAPVAQQTRDLGQLFDRDDADGRIQEGVEGGEGVIEAGVWLARRSRRVVLALRKQRGIAHQTLVRVFFKRSVKGTPNLRDCLKPDTQMNKDRAASEESHQTERAESKLHRIADHSANVSKSMLAEGHTTPLRL